MTKQCEIAAKAKLVEIPSTVELISIIISGEPYRKLLQNTSLMLTSI